MHSPSFTRSILQILIRLFDFSRRSPLVPGIKAFKVTWFTFDVRYIR